MSTVTGGPQCRSVTQVHALSDPDSESISRPCTVSKKAIPPCHAGYYLAGSTKFFHRQFTRRYPGKTEPRDGPRPSSRQNRRLSPYRWRPANWIQLLPGWSFLQDSDTGEKESPLSTEPRSNYDGNHAIGSLASNHGLPEATPVAEPFSPAREFYIAVYGLLYKRDRTDSPVNIHERLETATR